MSGLQPPAPHDMLPFVSFFGSPSAAAPRVAPASTAVAPTGEPARTFGGAAVVAPGFSSAGLGAASGAGAAGALLCAAGSAAGDAGAAAAAGGSGAALAAGLALLHPTDAVAPSTVSAATNVSSESDGLRIDAS